MGHIINDFREFENVLYSGKKIAIFGAGSFGKTWIYDLINELGFQIYCYFDNNAEIGSIVRGTVSVHSLEELYNNKEEFTIFLGVNIKLQRAIENQFEVQGIYEYYIIDLMFMQKIIESVKASNDENIMAKYKCIVDDVEFIKMQFRECVGYELDLNNPQSFNEKLQYLKLHDHKSEYTTMVDKYLAKEYVSRKIGSEYIIPTIGVWDKYEDIDFDEMPAKFVLKCNHDSGSAIIVKDKTIVNHENLSKRLNTAIETQFYYAGREWPYKSIERKIIAEPFMEEESKMIDYKFMCFQGKVELVFTCSERFSKSGLRVTFFDRDWNKLPFQRHYPSSEKRIEAPKNLAKMIELAEKLSMGIPFVRVDFYEINEQIYFGEMTFFPGGGMEEFSPIEWDYRLGELIDIGDI